MGFFSVLGNVAAFVVSPGGYVAYKGVQYVRGKVDESKNDAREEGRAAGQAAATKKYEEKVRKLTERMQNYHDFDTKLVALYAIGLAVANADGEISTEERDEIDAFISGCAGGHLPTHVKKTINELTVAPPSLERAFAFAAEADLPKKDINDVIDIVAMADGEISSSEKAFITRWKKMAREHQAAGEVT